MRRIANFIESQNSYSTKKNVNNKNISVSALKKDYNILLERNNILASALGACGLCWGTVVDCECRGEGKVGSRVPNKEAFIELILPVLKYFNSEVVENKSEGYIDLDNENHV
jgi:hypothetical protein